MTYLGIYLEDSLGWEDLRSVVLVEEAEEEAGEGNVGKTHITHSGTN